MPSNTLSAQRILVIEDDASVRQLMAKHFRRHGYVVVEAEDAASALALTASDTAFDLILTDVHLPDDSGVVLARRLHVQAPLAPIVFVTGDPDAALAREALETDGAAAYLVKPFRLFELDAVVDGVLSRKPAVEIVIEDRAERHMNRISHLFEALDMEALEADESISTLSDERTAALQSVLDAGDSYDVVEPRYRLRLLGESAELSALPLPRLNVRQAMVLAAVILLGVLMSVGLPGAGAAKSGVVFTSPIPSVER